MEVEEDYPTQLEGDQGMSWTLEAEALGKKLYLF